MTSCPLCIATHSVFVASIDSSHGVYHCQRCDVVFLWPQPSGLEITSLYDRDYFSAWGFKEGERASVREMKMATFRYYVRLLQRFCQRRAILDIGCAMGYFLEVAQQHGFSPYGVELSPYAAGVAQRRFGVGRIVQGTLEDALFAPGSFSVITMFDLIEHIPDPRALLVRVRELLTDSGIALIVTPNHGSLSRLLMGSSWTHYKLEHLFYFDPESLHTLCARVGLRVVVCRSAIKALTVEYVFSQFVAYRHRVLTPFFSLLSRMIPMTVQRRSVFIPIGEMMAVLCKA